MEFLERLERSWGSWNTRDAPKSRRLIFKYYPFHQITKDELEGLGDTWSSKDSLWGWHLGTVHIFDPPLIYDQKARGEVVWLYLDPKYIALPFQRSQTGSLSTNSAEESQSGMASSNLKRKSTSFTDSFGDEERENDEDLIDESKRARTTTAESDPCNGFDFQNPDATVTCITLFENEWDAMLKGCSCLLRPFCSRETRLCALVQYRSGFSWVGILTLKSCEEYKAANTSMRESCFEVYGRTGLQLFKKAKNLFFWQLKEITILEEKSQLAWIDRSFKNRTFSLPVSRLHPTYLPHPASPDLGDTCSYFLELCDEHFQHKIVKQVRELSGRRIRVATACSGSDICITVIRQTLQRMNASQDGWVYNIESYGVRMLPGATESLCISL